MVYLMRNKIITFVLLQVISYFLWGAMFSSYIVLLSCLSFVVYGAYRENRLKFSYFILSIMFVSFFYSLFSVYSNSPEKILNGGVLKAGNYEITRHVFRSRPPGAYTSRDGYVEPSSYGDLFLKNNDEIVRVSCSINESGCPFYNEYNKSIYVEYFYNYNLNKNFALHIGDNESTYDSSFFKKSYNHDFYYKILFIMFYIIPMILLVIALLKGKIVAKKVID